MVMDPIPSKGSPSGMCAGWTFTPGYLNTSWIAAVAVTSWSGRRSPSDPRPYAQFPGNALSYEKFTGDYNWYSLMTDPEMRHAILTTGVNLEWVNAWRSTCKSNDYDPYSDIQLFAEAFARGDEVWMSCCTYNRKRLLIALNALRTAWAVDSSVHDELFERIYKTTKKSVLVAQSSSSPQ